MLHKYYIFEDKMLMKNYLSITQTSHDDSTNTGTWLLITVVSGDRNESFCGTLLGKSYAH